MAKVDLSGKVALIAGGTNGIGRATAEGLAQMGARLVIVGRNQVAGQQVVADIQQAGGQADFIAADLSLMSSVRELAATIKARYDRLDVLIQCADNLAIKRQSTAEGLEASFAVNYLGRFLLINLLTDLLKASAPARIIHVAAAGMSGKFDLADIPPGPQINSFNGHNLGQKANDVLGVELAARLQGTGVTINIMNPGIVDTSIRRRASTGLRAKMFIGTMELLMRPLTQTPTEFAEKVIYLATSPEVEGVSGGLFDRKLKPIAVKPQISDPTTRRLLWDKSVQVTGLDSPAPAKIGK